MARVNINIKCDEAAEIESVVIGDLENASSCFVQADYTEPAAGSGGTVTSYGTFDIDYDNTQAVIPYKTTAAQGFDASYSAILIPIDYESFGISITLTDGSQFYYIGGIYEYNEDGPNPFDPGTVNTFNITIKNKELTVDGHFDAATGQTSDPVSVNNWRIHQ